MRSNNKRRKGTKGPKAPRGATESRSSDRSSETQWVKDTEKNNTFGGNSIEWYSRYPNLLLAAGSIPYPYKPGMDVPLGTVMRSGGSTEPRPIEYNYPGIISFDWMPSVGYSSTQTSPISIVGKEVYAKVREKFSGSIDADAPDFVMYFMALDSIFSFIAALKRIYRTLNAYSPENYFTPTGILPALGLTEPTVEDLRQHKMELYQRINELVLMTRKFKCPRIMDIFNRHVWLNDHVYTDAPTIKSQFYVFVQYAFYKFTMLPVPGTDPAVQAGGLQITNLYPVPSTNAVQYLYQFGRDLIDALAASDDGYLISGYLMRAYEGFPDFTVDELLLDEELIPKYNEEVLGEIENLHTLPGGADLISNTVSQNPATNAVIARPTVHYPATSLSLKFRIDGIMPRFSARSDNPTVAESVINSRLMTYIDTFGTPDAQGATANIVACTEIVAGMNMYRMNLTDRGITWVASTYNSDMIIDSDEITGDNIKPILTLLSSSAWDWMPLMYLHWSGAAGNYDCLLGDIHNFTTVQLETLKNINTVCLYSLFNAFSQM